MLGTNKDGMKVTVLHIALAGLIVSPAPVFAWQTPDDAPLDALDTGLPKLPVPKQEPAGAAELRDAVRRIAQQPNDSFALTDAGYAAIKLDDYDAAFNFFTKANAIRPSDARIKTGLGVAQVRRENPFEALSLFDEAVRLGANERGFAMDRALAFDLLGNFERAERDYSLAASQGGSDELTLRHAISLSLAGRKDDADRLLIPLLQRDNPEAWRARALMLAARGDSKEAGKIALGFLSEREARRMDGYFRNMTRLTVAQQAAAMHFGHFPVGSNIGEDSDSVRTLANATGARPVSNGGDSRLIPAGEPLGAKVAAVKIATVKTEPPAKAKGKVKKPKSSAADLSTMSAQQAVDAAGRARVTPIAANQLPVPESARPPVRIALPALTMRKTPAAELPAIGPAVLPNAGAGVVIGSDQNQQKSAAIAQTQDVRAPIFERPIASVQIAEQSSTEQSVAKPELQPQPQPVLEPVLESVKTENRPIGPGFISVDPTPAIIETKQIDIGTIAAEPAAKPVEVATVPAAVTSEKNFDLGALVESIEVPEDQKRPSVAPVDLRKIRVAAAKPEMATAKADIAAKVAKQPASVPRIFVQIATGADAAGLGYDYRRMAKKFGSLFVSHDGWTSPWGKTKRLLVGPFPDMKAAKKWETDFRKAGGDGFVWQSDKTVEVEKLKSK